MAFVAFSNVVDHQTTVLDAKKVTTKVDDNGDDGKKDELLQSYNAFLLEHIKFEKIKKKVFENLDEKEHEISILKKILEEKKSLLMVSNLILPKVRTLKKIMKI